MSRRRSVRKELGMVAIAAAFALVVVGEPAYAGGRHRHYDGVGGYFSFDYSSPAYEYYEPYPYAPAHAYPPAYDPPYGAYDDEPMYYDDGSYQYESPGRSSNGSYCREFQTTIVIDGRPEQAFGTACLQPDGSWAVVN